MLPLPEFARRVLGAERAAAQQVVAPVRLKGVVRSETARQWQTDDWLLKLECDLVRSGELNRNNRMWENSDLEYGLPSVQHKPVNMLHDQNNVVGVITEAVLEDLEDEYKKIVIQADVWQWVAWYELDEIIAFAETGKLFCSMECLPSKIQSLETGVSYDYLDYLDGKAEKGLYDRSVGARMVDPIFRGVGLIPPPSEPGWAQAITKITKDQTRPLG